MTEVTAIGPPERHNMPPMLYAHIVAWYLGPSRDAIRATQYIYACWWGWSPERVPYIRRSGKRFALEH